MEENRSSERNEYNTREASRRQRSSSNALKGFEVNFEQQRGSYKNSDFGGNGRPQERSNDDRNGDDRERNDQVGARR